MATVPIAIPESRAGRAARNTKVPINTAYNKEVATLLLVACSLTPSNNIKSDGKLLLWLAVQ